MSVIAILDFYAALLSFIVYVAFIYRLNFENISNCTHLALLVAKVHYSNLDSVTVPVLSLVLHL